MSNSFPSPLRKWSYFSLQAEVVDQQIQQNLQIVPVALLSPMLSVKVSLVLNTKYAVHCIFLSFFAYFRHMHLSNKIQGNLSHSVPLLCVCIFKKVSFSFLHMVNFIHPISLLEHFFKNQFLKSRLTCSACTFLKSIK